MPWSDVTVTKNYLSEKEVDAGGMKFRAKYGVVGLAVVRQDRHRTSFGQVSRHTERYALDVSHRSHPP